jgi:hypothetical protein
MRRDEEDRAAAFDSWLRSGGDEKAFDREWEAISTEAKRIRMQEASAQAHADAMRREWERF